MHYFEYDPTHSELWSKQYSKKITVKGSLICFPCDIPIDTPQID